MTVTLQNSKLKVVINSKGAEINSFTKADGKDIIWNGSPDIWKFHAPVLFPHCGKTKDGFVIIDDMKYPLKSNGFARDLEFKLVEQTGNSVKFELTENEYTLERFPYRFRLSVKYVLMEDKLEFTTAVKNTGSEPFMFSAGSHSAFAIDGVENYQIEFENKKPLKNVVCCENGLLAADSEGKCPYVRDYGEAEPGIIPVTAAGFGNGHLFTETDSAWVGLRNKKDGSLIKVNTKDYPYVMIWQNAGEPNFVCIEPWFGMPDADNTDHQWVKKPGLVKLDVGKKFTTDQSISV